MEQLIIGSVYLEISDQVKERLEKLRVYEKWKKNIEFYFNNCIRSDCSCEKLQYETQYRIDKNTISDLLMYSFDWDESIEGREFWEEVWYCDYYNMIP